MEEMHMTGVLRAYFPILRSRKEIFPETLKIFQRVA